MKLCEDDNFFSSKEANRADCDFIRQLSGIIIIIPLYSSLYVFILA